MKKKPISTNEIRSIELDGLCLLRDKCNELGLKYYLAFGTLLGAVRHKGFIPWDDDIDILMPRKDYDKLLNNSSFFNTEDWEVVSNETNKDYCLLWTKYCNKKTIITPVRFNTGYTYGISIDVFPLDFIDADTVEEAESFIKEVRSFYNAGMKKIQVRAITKKDFYSKIQRIVRKTYYLLIGRLIGDQTEVIKETNAIIKRRCMGGKYAIYAYSKYGKAWEAKDFESSEKKDTYLVFENELFSVPENYDAVLRRSYNDYMQLPPKEKQVTLHSFDAYYIE